MATFSDEQAAFATSMRELLTRIAPAGSTRALMAGESGSKPAAWDQLTRTGLSGLHVPERYGGQGSELLELTIVTHEMGRALFCGPYLSSTFLATTAVLYAGGEAARQRLLPGLAAATEHTALAVADNGGGELRNTTATFRHDGDEVQVSATCPFVVDAHTADYLVLPARAQDVDDEGLALLLVPHDATGIERTPLRTDHTRRLVRVRLTDAPGEIISDGTVPPVMLDRVNDIAELCLAAESVGGAGRCLEMACDYARVRTAFGQPIGAFQAVKHKAADHYIIEETRALTRAAATADVESVDFRLLVSLAKATAGEAFEQVAFDNILIHGGIGFTWEHAAHLYLRRAQSNAKLLGDTADLHERASALLSLQ